MWWHVLELGKESGLSSAELRVLGGERHGSLAPLGTGEGKAAFHLGA